jgi:hypothetical protein
MHCVLGWQVGPVPGADTTALEGATVLLKPAENCKIDCRLFVEFRKAAGKLQASSIEKLLENQKKGCCKTVRLVPGDPRIYVRFYKKNS